MAIPLCKSSRRKKKTSVRTVIENFGHCILSRGLTKRDAHHMSTVFSIPVLIDVFFSLKSEWR